MVIENKNKTNKTVLLDVCSTAFNYAEKELLEFISDEDYYNAYKAASHTISALKNVLVLDEAVIHENGLINDSWFCLKAMTSYSELISKSINNNELLIKNYTKDSIQSFANSIRTKFNQLFYKQFLLNVLVDYHREDYSFHKLKLEDYNFFRKLKKRTEFLELATGLMNNDQLQASALTRVFDSLLADNCFDFLESEVLELLELIQYDEQNQLLSLVNALQNKSSNHKETLKRLSEYLDNESMEEKELLKKVLLITREKGVNEAFISLVFEGRINYSYTTKVSFTLNRLYKLLKENFFTKEELLLITELSVKLINKYDYWMTYDASISYYLLLLLEQLASYGELDGFIEKTKGINGFYFEKEDNTVRVMINCDYYNNTHGKGTLLDKLLNCLIDGFQFMNKKQNKKTDSFNYELSFNEPELFKKEALWVYNNFVKSISNNVVLQGPKAKVTEKLRLLLLADNETKKAFVGLVKKLDEHKAIDRIVFVSEYDQLYSNFWFVFNQLNQNL